MQELVAAAPLRRDRALHFDDVDAAAFDFAGCVARLPSLSVSGETTVTEGAFGLRASLPRPGPIVGVPPPFASLFHPKSDNLRLQHSGVRRAGFRR
jgi:hypothetical protein